MAKQVEAIIKLQIKAGAANPSPPVGPALGSKGVNIMDFCKQFNARTQEQAGKIIPVIIQVYGDKSFDFITKQPPVAIQLLEVAKIAERHELYIISDITWDQVRAIATDKMKDLNAFEIEKAMSMVAGTARSMGITVTGDRPF